MYYKIQSMNTYGGVERVLYNKIGAVNDQRITYKYPELVYNHYRYIYEVCGHNNRW